MTADQADPVLAPRRSTRKVPLGPIAVGGDAPITVQTMTTTPTNDVDATLQQIAEVTAAGCDIVRVACPRQEDADALAAIVAKSPIPVIADIHFQPRYVFAAIEAGCAGVRVNPGNIKAFDDQIAEIARAATAHGTSLRIGINAGSLDERLLAKHGRATPEALVDSALSEARLFENVGFGDFAISVKHHDVVTTIEAYRLLSDACDYPLHLGVTEAGPTMQGTVKSCAAFGVLLAEGIGDTIRVSLTEEPEREIPVAQMIVDYFAAPNHKSPFTLSPYNYRRRESDPVGRLGGGNVPLLLSELNSAEQSALETGKIVLLNATDDNPATFWRSELLRMEAAGDRRPVILSRGYTTTSPEELAVKAAADFAPIYIDGMGDGIDIVCPDIAAQTVADIALIILQAARVRISRTDYIACPGCGRTLFDLQATLAAVRERTSHLHGLKIGVMGCIVNGPGEMADADFGYVGSGRGLVTLYRGREVMRRNIPQAEAMDALEDLIVDSGKWKIESGK